MPLKQYTLTRVCYTVDDFRYFIFKIADWNMMHTVPPIILNIRIIYIIY